MNQHNQITIHNVIVHKVDYKKYTSAQLSDLETPLSPDVETFLTQHIRLNREHKYTRTAIFSDSSESKLIARSMYYETISDPSKFITQSQAIAIRLFNILKNDKRTSPSDLVVCTFSENTHNQKWLALLKLDPKDGYVGEIEEINGKKRINLQLVQDVLPSGELQKAAFILPVELAKVEGFDLKVLDVQAIRYGGKRIVASFFIKNFLQCTVGLEPIDKTKAFVKGSYQWIKSKHELWPPEDIDRFKTRCKTVIQDEIVDITAFSNAVIPEAQERDEYLQYMIGQGLDELSFVPDPKERTKLTKYVYFMGDHGLKVRIQKEALNDGILRYELDEVTNTWFITIRTIRWEQSLS